MLTHLNHNTMYLFSYHHNGLMSTYAFEAHEAPRTVCPKCLSCHSRCCDRREGTLYHNKIYCVHFAYSRFDHPVS